MSVDESLGESRQMQASVDESKNFLIPEKVANGPFCFCCNYATVSHINIGIFNL